MEMGGGVAMVAKRGINQESKHIKDNRNPIVRYLRKELKLRRGQKLE